MANDARRQAALRELARRQAMKKQQESLSFSLPPDTPSVDPRVQAAQKELARRSTPATPKPLEQNQQLLNQMGGKLPSPGVSLEKLWSPTGHLLKAERKRRSAHQQLIDRGFSHDDIVGALAFEESLKPQTKTPQVIGSFAAGLLATQVLPGPFDDIAFGAGVAKKMSMGRRLARAGGRAAIEGLGGVAGRATQVAFDPDSEFNAQQLAKVFGEETAYGVGGEALGAAGRRLIRPVRKLIPGAAGISDTIQAKARKMGLGNKVRLLPAQASPNKLVDTLQGIGEGGLIDWGVIDVAKGVRVNVATSLVEDVSSDAIARGAKNMSPVQLRDLMLDVIEDRGVSHGVVVDKLYDAVEVAIGPGAKVDLGRTGVEAQRMLTRAGKALDIGETAESLELLKRLSGTTGQEAKIVDWETSTDIRSRLLKVLRKAGSKVAPDPQMVSHVGKLVSLVDEAMEQAAKDSGPDAERLWRRANWYLKAGKERYHNKLLNKLIHDLPDNPDASRAIFKNEQNIIRVKKAVGSEKFQMAKKAWYDSIVKDSMLKNTAEPLSAAGIPEVPLGKRIAKSFNSIGQPALDAAFTKSEQKIIRQNARILEVVQEKTGGHSGALRFVQGAALIGVLASPLYAEQPGGKEAAMANAAVLIGPAVLAKLMTKPKFGRWLSEGYKAPRGTQQAVTATARLLRNVFQARLEVNAEREKARKRGPWVPKMKIKQPTLQQLRGHGGRGF